MEGKRWWTKWRGEFFYKWLPGARCRVADKGEKGENLYVRTLYRKGEEGRKERYKRYSPSFSGRGQELKKKREMKREVHIEVCFGEHGARTASIIRLLKD